MEQSCSIHHKHGNRAHITLHLIRGTKLYNAVDDILHILRTVLSAMSLYSISQKKISL